MLKQAVKAKVKHPVRQYGDLYFSFHPNQSTTGWPRKTCEGETLVQFHSRENFYSMFDGRCPSLTMTNHVSDFRVVTERNLKLG